MKIVWNNTNYKSFDSTQKSTWNTASLPRPGSGLDTNSETDFVRSCFKALVKLSSLTYWFAFDATWSKKRCYYVSKGAIEDAS